jgi:TolB-like protein/DNA-binding winged helix-turn-helix (wHTH) protein/Tfp pilus assembly protein PilF
LDSVAGVPDEVYQAGDLCIDAGRRLVTRDGFEIPLPNLSFDLLLTLTRAHPRMLTTEELLDSVWAPAVVNPETVGQRVKLLRQALGDDPHMPRYVVNVRGRGYRMDIPVSRRQRDLQAVELRSKRRQTSPGLQGAKAVAAAPMPDAVVQPRALAAALRPRRFQLLAIGAGIALATVGALLLNRHDVRARHDSKAQLSAVADLAADYGAAPERSIAVLPFLDLTGTRDEKHLVDGVTEELTSLLSQIRNLRVTARTSAFYYRDKGVPVGDIGRALGVGYVVEGSVRRAGDRLRVTVQLIRTSTGYHVWSADYDRRADDLIAVEEDVARIVADRLNVALSASAVRNKMSVNPDARALFMHAYAAFAQENAVGDTQGIADLERAVRLDPNFALAWAALSYGYVVRTNYGDVHWAELRAKSLDAAEHSLGIEPVISDAHTAKAQFLLADWNVPGALEEARLALDEEPNEYHALRLAAYLQLICGHYEQGVSLLRELLSREPTNYFNYADLGKGLRSAGRPLEAARAFETALALNPRAERVPTFLALVHLEAGDAQGALAFLQRANNQRELQLLRPSILDAIGRRAEAAHEQAAVEREYRDVAPYELAAYYARRGDASPAMTWLEKAYDKHDPSILWIKSDPALKRLRTDARFQAMLTRLNIPE